MPAEKGFNNVAEKVLEMRDISKYFPGVQALENINFDVRKGEIHALVGQNGAGKSTLLKILAGIYNPDKGTITIHQTCQERWTPRQMMEQGIGFIYQELNLFQTLSIVQNLFAGREYTQKIGLISKYKMRARAKEALARLGLRDIDVEMAVKDLPVAKQQIVAIARALSQKPSLLVLDEPTSRLSMDDAQRLFEILESMRDESISIIYVSHRMDEIYRISDRITVLRDGKHIITDETKSITSKQLVKYMVGEELAKKEFHRAPNIRGKILDVEKLSGNGFSDISFSLSAGEVLGLVGAVGAGKTELIRAIFGIDNISHGEMSISGDALVQHNPGNAILHGVALCPEDRKYQGLVLQKSIKENITLAGLKKFVKFGGLVDYGEERRVADGLIKRLRIATTSANKPARDLSGGNQQKVVLAKWFCTDSRVFLFDEPTVGVDIQGKAEIYDLMHELADGGAGVLFVTSDLDEGLQVSDRLLVMYKGSLIAELDPTKTNMEEVSMVAMGGTHHEEM